MRWTPKSGKSSNAFLRGTSLVEIERKTGKKRGRTFEITQGIPPTDYSRGEKWWNQEMFEAETNFGPTRHILRENCEF